MPLVVEDGTGVAGADSYISLADARAYLIARGFSLPDDDTEAEAILRRAADYLNSLDARFPGKKDSPFQGLSWPRNVEGLSPESGVSGDSVPSPLIYAQALAAYVLQSGDLLESSAVESRAVVRQKVSSLERQFAAPQGGDGTSGGLPRRVALIEAILAPLVALGDDPGNANIRVCHV